LCNEVRRIIAYSDSGSIVGPDSLSTEIITHGRELKDSQAIPVKTIETVESPTPQTKLAEAVEDLERRMIQEALRRSEGNIAQAAKELGLSRKGLYLKLDRLKAKA
jgi:transcriptional regulator with PAS, ATPase and Fis domain